MCPPGGLVLVLVICGRSLENPGTAATARSSLSSLPAQIPVKNRKGGTVTGTSQQGRGEPAAGAGVKGGSRTGGRVIVYIAIAIVVIVAVVAAAFLTVSAETTPSSAGNAVFPYASAYELRIPVGQDIRAGNVYLLVVSLGDEMRLRVGNTTETFLIGQTRTVSQQHVTVRSLGIPVFDSEYRVDATYLGSEDNRGRFRLLVQTSRQLPQFVADRILPPGIQAVPAAV